MKRPNKSTSVIQQLGPTDQVLSRLCSSVCFSCSKLTPQRQIRPLTPVQWYLTGIRHTAFWFKRSGCNSRLHSVYEVPGMTSSLSSIWLTLSGVWERISGKLVAFIVFSYRKEIVFVYIRSSLIFSLSLIPYRIQATDKIRDMGKTPFAAR